MHSSETMYCLSLSPQQLSCDVLPVADSNQHLLTLSWITPLNKIDKDEKELWSWKVCKSLRSE